MGDHECSINSLRTFCRGSKFTFRQTIVDETGLPHERLFHVQTIVSNISKNLNIGIFDGFGQTIKMAKRNSALSALTTLKPARPSNNDPKKNEDANLLSILKLNEEDLLTSNNSYSDLVELGMLFKVPVRLLKSGPDYCVSFCHCTFASPISYVEASYKALRAIRTQIESLNQISIQSYAWRIDVVSRLLGLSLSFEVSELLNHPLRFSVNCILPPFTKTAASAKTMERAKELASRLMLSQLKKFEKSPSTISSNSQKSTKHPKKYNNRVRGSSDYSGSLNPVERLELIQQTNKQPEPVYNLEELYPPVKVILSCDGNEVVKSRRGPIKFLCTCYIGETAIRGDAYCNKRLAKRSAAEKALETLGVDAYRQLKIQNSSVVSHSQLPSSLKSGIRNVNITFISQDSAVSISCAKEVVLFDAASQSSIRFTPKSNRRSRSAYRPEVSSSMSRNTPCATSVGIDTFAYELNLLSVAPREDGYCKNPNESNQEVKGEEEPLPNPLQDIVSWKLLASLARVLTCWGSRDNLSPDSQAVSLDTQLLQMCNRFGIPCQLVELSGMEEKNKGWTPLQNGKFHKYAESGCTFLLQIGRTHSVSRFLSSSERVGDKFSESNGPQTNRLECGHNGRGGCFLSTGANRAECRQNLVLHALKCLIGPTQ
ncbi:unnamed protein product [Rodentolepis nana]|uniref:DRBM domain-containing protein n=1 Tax=Rodentolepis nana TaxID=102285 RepID=A0A0R3T208_RODNA|nr:unnamed protein product [Rodentolepis nana]